MSAHRWTTEHGEDGLRDKFAVYKAADDLAYASADVAEYLRAERIGADGEFVFVLRPETDYAAWLALRHYAGEVAFRAPKLSDDIMRELQRIDQRELGQ